MRASGSATSAASAAAWSGSPRVSGVARAAALVFALFVLMGGEAQATTFRVVVVPEYELGGIVGAVGLLVPGAGPETSEAMARAALVRGEVRNSLRGGLPEGPPLIG